MTPDLAKLKALAERLKANNTQVKTKVFSTYNDVGTDVVTWFHPDNNEAAEAILALLSHITRVEAERKQSDDFWNERCANTSMLAHNWMVAHDSLQAGKPYKYPEPADLPNLIKKLEAERDAAFNDGVEAVEKRLRDAHAKTKDPNWWNFANGLDDLKRPTPQPEDRI